MVLDGGKGLIGDLYNQGLGGKCGQRRKSHVSQMESGRGKFERQNLQAMRCMMAIDRRWRKKRILITDGGKSYT